MQPVQPIHSTINYQALWDSMIHTKPDVVNATAATIRKNAVRYQAVVAGTSLPWQWVACIHNRESSLRFDRHLHNGDPLSARTVNVPKGYPKTGQPPFTWEQSAKDALFTIKGLDKITDWSIAQALYQFERYNGWGYRDYHSDIYSPYLWSMTNHYQQGKYVADGHYDPKATDKQIGCAPLYKILLSNA